MRYARMLTRSLEKANSGHDLKAGEELQEVLAAIRNASQPPIQPRYDFFAVPFAFASRLRNRIGSEAVSEVSAAHLVLAGPFANDPAESSFWHRPKSIESQDLYHGFGRLSDRNQESLIWEYSGPKLSYGVNAGFEARCGDLKARIKFAETRSEPFAARIFWALGYNVDVTDYAPELKLKYNRRFFREFNLRKEIQTQFRFLTLPLYTMKLQKRYDPFAFVATAVMKDGRRITGMQLKRELLINPEVAPEDEPANFRANVESSIDYLVLVPANFQLRNRTAHSSARGSLVNSIIRSVVNCAQCLFWQRGSAGTILDSKTRGSKCSNLRTQCLNSRTILAIWVVD